MISIIVPVYQAEKYLRQCLDSIQQQTYPDWEAILVDDGSSDGSPAICDEYAKNDGRFKVIHQRNGGVSKARNKGLQVAQGSLITFVDADDRLQADALDYYRQQIRDGVDMVMAGYRRVSERRVDMFADEDKEQGMNREQALTMMYRPIWFPYQGYLWNKCYRKSIVDAHHLRFDEKIYFNEDRLFVTKYLCHTKGKIVYSSKVVYDYFVRSGSAMASLSKGYNLKFITDIMGYGGMRKAILAIHPSKDLVQLADDGILESYGNIVAHLIEGGYPLRRAQVRLMWMYMHVLGPRRLFHDIILPHFSKRI